ncbi:21143_t:CDS:2, partial [Gigaspora margarita]
DLITIENLTKQEYPLSSYLDGNLIEILNITNAFDEMINQDLLWCLLCMKFQSSDESANYIKFLARKILDHVKFLDYLKIRIFDWCKDNIPENWQLAVIVDIEFITEPKPDVYFVPNKRYGLKFPFSTYFIN